MTNMTNTLPLSACNRSQTGSSNILTTGQADMTKNLTFDELMGCTDCLLHVATGHAHEAERLGRDIEANIKQWLGVPSGRLSCGDSNNDNPFSWARCECCGSRLGGSRHQLFMRVEG